MKQVHMVLQCRRTLTGLAATDVTPSSMGLKAAGGVMTKPIELCMNYSAFHGPRGEAPAKQRHQQKNVHDLLLVGDST